MNTFLEIALRNAARGFRVHPLRVKDKAPLLSGWPDKATTDEATIRAWAEQYPDANCGILADADICILESDNLPELERQLFPLILRSSFVVQAREKRPHMYFRQTDATRRLGNCDLFGIFEFKQRNRQVVAEGSTHPTGAVYTVTKDLGGLYPMPDALTEALAALYGGQKKEAAEADGAPITECRNVALTSIAGKVRRALSLGYDTLLEHMELVNERRCQPPLPQEELETICRNQCTYDLPDEAPKVHVGGKKLVADAEARADIEIVEELDASLTATPLPSYPLSIFDGTLYGDFAIKASEGNYVPREFFIEGAMTYAGAVCNNRLRGMSEEITSRLYTVLLGAAGIGKGTTFRRIRKFVPPSRLLTDVDPKKAIPTGCSTLMDRAGSEPGLNDALLKHASVIEDFEEMDRLMEKTAIKGSGGALMSIIRSCFDDTVPGITTTGQRKVAAQLAYLSLLGAMTPSLWRQAMEGRDSYGSGLGGRFNLVATNEERTASDLLDMDIGTLHDSLDSKFVALECGDLVIPTETAARLLLREWWNDNAQGKAYYNRVNVIAHRKALHIAWIRDSRVITAEIMGQALQLGDYLVKVREAFAVVKGEDRTAINENKVLNVLKNIYPKGIRTKQMGRLLDGHVSRASVYRALEALTNSSEAEKIIRRPDATSKSPYAVYRCLTKG